MKQKISLAVLVIILLALAGVAYYLAIKKNKEPQKVADSTDIRGREIDRLEGPNESILFLESGDTFNVSAIWDDSVNQSVEQISLVLADPSGQRHLIYQTPIVSKGFYLEGIRLHDVHFSPSGKYAVARVLGYEWGWMIVFDLGTGEIVFNKDHDLSMSAHSEIWSPDDQFLAFQTGRDFPDVTPDAVYLLRLSDGEAMPVVDAAQEGSDNQYYETFSEVSFLDNNTLILYRNLYDEHIRVEYTYTLADKKLVKRTLPL